MTGLSADWRMAIAFGVCAALALTGSYVLKRTDPSMRVRVAFGAAALGIGLLLTCVAPGLQRIVGDPLLLGLSAALAGLGINQLAAPIRKALGMRV